MTNRRKKPVTDRKKPQKALPTEMCDSCEEEPPTIVINVTTLDGTLLDQKKVCRTCASHPVLGYGFDVGAA